MSKMLADRPSTDKPKGKKREIIPIPPGSPEMPKYEEMNNKIEDIKKKADGYRAEMEKLKDAYGQLGGESEERKQAREDLKTLRAQKSELLTDLSELRMKNRKIAEDTRNTEREIRDVTQELRKEQKGSDVELLDPKSIDKKIKELEFKIESGGVGSLKGEKRVMQEIKAYNLMKDKSKELLAKSDGMLDAKSRAEKSRGERNNNQLKIDSLTDQLEAVIERMGEVKKTLDATSSNDERTKIRAQKEELHQKVNKCYEEMDKLRKDHKAKKEAYFAWKQKYDEEVKQFLAKQREARILKEKEDEEKRKLEKIEYEELKKLNPYESEISQCTVLIDYLKRKADLKHMAVPAAKKAEPTEAFDAAKAMEKLGGKGLMQLGRKDDSADFFQMKKTKKAPAKKITIPPPAKKASATTETVASTTSKPRKLTHDYNKEGMFKKFGLNLPMFAHECKPMIATLEEKVAEYKTHIRTPAQLAEERKANAAAEAAKAAAEAATEAAKDEE